MILILIRSIIIGKNIQFMKIIYLVTRFGHKIKTQTLEYLIN